MGKRRASSPIGLGFEFGFGFGFAFGFGFGFGLGFGLGLGPRALSNLLGDAAPAPQDNSNNLSLDPLGAAGAISSGPVATVSGGVISSGPAPAVDLFGAPLA